MFRSRQRTGAAGRRSDSRQREAVETEAAVEAEAAVTAGRAERQLRRENVRLQRQLAAVRGQYRRLETFVSELELLAGTADTPDRGRAGRSDRSPAASRGVDGRPAPASGADDKPALPNGAHVYAESVNGPQDDQLDTFGQAHAASEWLQENRKQGQDPGLLGDQMKRQAHSCPAAGQRQNSVIFNSATILTSRQPTGPPAVSAEPWPHFSQPSLEQLIEILRLIQEDRDAARAASLRTSPPPSRREPPGYCSERGLVRRRPPPSLVRLQPVPRHQASFSCRDQVALRALTAAQVVEELERQAAHLLPELSGVRVLDDTVFLSAASAAARSALLGRRLTVRGLPVTLQDETTGADLLLLTGVPHYVRDAAVLAVAAVFGTPRGLPERRLYRGVETGERLVLLRLRAGLQLPPSLTLGGLRLTLRLLSPDRLDGPLLAGPETPPANLPRSPPPHYSQAVGGREEGDLPGRWSDPAAPQLETMVKRPLTAPLPAPGQSRWAERPVMTQPSRERAVHQAGYPVWPAPECPPPPGHQPVRPGGDGGLLLLSTQRQTNGDLVCQTLGHGATARPERTEGTEPVVRRQKTPRSGRTECFSDRADRSDLTDRTGYTETVLRCERADRGGRRRLSERDRSLERLSSGSGSDGDGDGDGDTAVSVSPQDGSELPWCGCWGNGCF